MGNQEFLDFRNVKHYMNVQNKVKDFLLRVGHIRWPEIPFRIRDAANTCIPDTRTALPWELANGVEIRGDPQSAPTGLIL